MLPLSQKTAGRLLPERVIDLIRRIGIQNGGKILEDCKLTDVRKEGSKYFVLVQDHEKKYIEFETEIFINALGPEGERFAKQLNIETGTYPVKHQAFITRRLPMLGIKGIPLPMIIDRRRYKGFTAVYGQQLAETGQIIGCASPAVEPPETGFKPQNQFQRFHRDRFRGICKLDARALIRWFSGCVGGLLCGASHGD